MPKSPEKPTIREQILECLKDGEKSIAEIYEVVSGQESSIRSKLRELKKDGEIGSPERGQYCLPTPSDAPAVTENLRGETENTETINKLLNLYDKLLDAVALSIENEDWDGIVDKIETIKSMRWLGATIDQLMKRWYLVHRGYDSNTKQAQEDAKQKTADRAKQELEQLPPEERINVIRSYDVTMQELIEKLPGKVDHQV